MAKSRQRKKIQQEKLKQKITEFRSEIIETGPADFSSLTDVFAAIDSLTKGIKPQIAIPKDKAFDLNRYEKHIEAHIGTVAVNLRDIPPLHEDKRKDLIWRFIAVVFLAHAGIVEIKQDGLDIMVRKNETYRKRQGVPGEFEDANRFEGSFSRIET